LTQSCCRGEEVEAKAEAEFKGAAWTHHFHDWGRDWMTELPATRVVWKNRHSWVGVGIKTYMGSTRMPHEPECAALSRALGVASLPPPPPPEDRRPRSRNPHGRLSCHQTDGLGGARPWP